MEDAGTISVWEILVLWSPQLWPLAQWCGKRVEGSSPGLVAPQALGQWPVLQPAQKVPTPLWSLPIIETLHLLKNHSAKRAFCLHSTLEYPGASIFYEIAFHFFPFLLRAIISHWVVLCTSIFNLVKVFFFHLTNAQSINKTSKISSNSFCGFCLFVFVLVWSPTGEKESNAQITIWPCPLPVYKTSMAPYC